MEENQQVAKFKIVCIKCDKEDKKHDTLLYVQWEKKYYMITCHNCGTMEAFDEFAKKIDISEDHSANLEKEEENETKKRNN